MVSSGSLVVGFGVRFMSSTLTDGINETLWIADVVGIDPNKFMGFVFVKNAGVVLVGV